MQIVCEYCGFTGPAGDVAVEGGDVVMYCKSCGGANKASSSGASTPSAGKAQPTAVQPTAAQRAAVQPTEASPTKMQPPAARSEQPASATNSAAASPADAALDAALSPALIAMSAMGAGGQRPASHNDFGPAPELDYQSQRTDLPPVKCPKCGQRQHDREACHSCGLVFSLVKDGVRPWETVPKGKEAEHAAAETLWSKVETSVDDRGAHDAFLNHCLDSSLAALAARRYRHLEADHPHHALIRRQTEVAVKKAQAAVEFYTNSGQADPYVANTEQVRQIVLGLVALFFMIVTILLVRGFAN